MKKVFVLLCSVLLSGMATLGVSAENKSLPPVQKAEAGTVERLIVASPELKDSVVVDIWLPEGYDRSEEKRYPVLYMHDGQNLYDSATTWNGEAWEMDRTAGSLIEKGEMPAIIIVGIHSDPQKRVSQLMPEKAVRDAGLEDLMAEVKLKGEPVMGDKYAAFVVNTLKPLVDGKYNTMPEKESTAVMGSSMGGLMSLYLFCEYPEIFGGAGCLSTHWYGALDAGDAFGNALMEYVKTKLPDSSSHRIYFDQGTSTLDYYYGPWNTKALLIAQEKGYQYGDNLDSFVDYGAPHDENAWASRVDRPLRFLFLIKK